MPEQRQRVEQNRKREELREAPKRMRCEGDEAFSCGHRLGFETSCSRWKQTGCVILIALSCSPVKTGIKSYHSQCKIEDFSLLRYALRHSWICHGWLTSFRRHQIVAQSRCAPCSRLLWLSMNRAGKVERLPEGWVAGEPLPPVIVRDAQFCCTRINGGVPARLRALLPGMAASFESTAVLIQAEEHPANF
jgi:hypothetical protein